MTGEQMSVVAALPPTAAILAFAVVWLHYGQPAKLDGGLESFWWGERMEQCPEDFRDKQTRELPTCFNGHLWYPGQYVPITWRLRRPWW